MAAKSYKSAVNITLLIALLFLVPFNLGARNFHILASENITETPTETPSTTEEPLQTESPEVTTPTPTSTLTPLPSLDKAPEPTSTDTPSSEKNIAPAEAKQLPEPEILTHGVYVPNQLIIRFKHNTRDSRVKECLNGLDVQIASTIDSLHTFVLNVTSGEIAGAYYHLMDCAGALYVEPNYLAQIADTIPNDPSFSLQYGLGRIRAPQGWDLSTGSNSVIVAIVDTGVDLGHPDLVGKFVTGTDIVNNDSNPQDDNGHGTHVAGIAAATGNNSIGIAGVSWGARIMPVKVLNSAGNGSYANAAEGIIWATDHGAQIVNLSLGGSTSSSTLEDAINYAYNNGVLVVAAAGNTGGTPVLYPARYSHVIAVAATDSLDHRIASSSYGPEIDLSAPGASIYSTVPGGYGYKSGTSMASAFVSGLAAVLRGIPGNTSPDTIEFQMESTALDIESAGWDIYTGAGLIQMDAAIQAALPVPPTATPINLEPSSNGGERSFVYGGNYLPAQVIPSVTFQPTYTVSPTSIESQVPSTFTPTSQSSPIDTQTATNTPVAADENQDNQLHALGAPDIRQFILPCTGSLLILLGLFLALRARKKQQRLSKEMNLYIRM